MKFGMIVLSLFISSFAFAADELTNIIQCHEALDGKSEGQTQKLGYDSATPFTLADGKKLYFVTDASISVLENTFQGKTLLIHLKEKDKDFYRQMAINTDGRIESISFDEVTSPTEAQESQLSLNDESLSLLKKDLLRRVDSMAAELQNKFDPKDTLAALKTCEAVKLPELKKSLEKQTAFYEETLKNPAAYFQGLKKKIRSADKGAN
jgi:hypothetical protein